MPTFAVERLNHWGVSAVTSTGSRDHPTDIDNNGRTDTALREIYDNRAFPWGVPATRPENVDIDSVASHEAGHAFGLGHFGKVFLDN